MDVVSELVEEQPFQIDRSVFNSGIGPLEEALDNLNKDATHFMNSNDECTPMGCVREMVSSVPKDFWKNPNLKILDPCSGNGNFHAHLLRYTNLENLVFNEINSIRIENVKKLFGSKAKVINKDFLDFNPKYHQYDMVVANPPYAVFNNGIRVSKNHSLSRLFIKKALEVLKPSGLMLFIVPDNWMSLSDRNQLPMELSKYQFLHLNIHGAKKWFPKIGSSFTWFLLKKEPNKNPFKIENHYLVKDTCKARLRENSTFIPLYFNSKVARIFEKTIYSSNEKYLIETSSDLHKFTKKDIISTIQNEEFQYPLIHTPTQKVYSKRPHKYQKGWKVFLSLTNKYGTFVGDEGMTQSIAFIRCKNKLEAKRLCKELNQPIYKFLNDLTRYGNFNNIRIMQKFPRLEQIKLTALENELIESFVHG